MRGLAVAASVAALAPAPAFLRFEASELPAGISSTPGLTPCGLSAPFVSPGSAHGGSGFLFAPCRPVVHFTFARPQATVELFARNLRDAAPNIVVEAHTTDDTILQKTIAAPGDWKPVVMAAPGGAAVIDRVDVRAGDVDIGIDDVALSEAPQPDTDLSAGTSGHDARFSLVANRDDVDHFECSLDGAAFVRCASPVQYQDLTEGRHTFSAVTVDAYGGRDPSPASYAWAVLPPAPDTQMDASTPPVVFGNSATVTFGSADPDVAGYECRVDGGPFIPCTSPYTAPDLTPGPHTIEARAVDADGRPDPTPLIWAVDIPGTLPGPRPPDIPAPADRDRDGIPDTRETLPLGDVPPVAGVRAVARLISGRVRVRLPARFPEGFGTEPTTPVKGYVPLDGVATLPVGTVVDARNGTLSLDSALDGRGGVQQTTLSAAIFRIRQARVRAAQRAQIPTDLALVSPPRAEQRCRRARKGVVRRITTRATGFVRVLAKASRTTARNASFSTTDRCDGTLTRVSRGRVRVYDRGRRRTVTVRAHHRYLARARLFSVRKGRKPAGRA